MERDPLDFIAWNKLTDHSLRLLRVTGDLTWLAKAAHAAESSLKAAHNSFNSAGLGARGRVELAQHRFQECLATGRELRGLQPNKASGLVLLSDASFELGDYAGAEEYLHEAVRMEEELSVGSESREAKFAVIRGKLEQAVVHLNNALTIARREITPADVLAWLEVQLGEIAFKQGRWDEAQTHYAAAEKEFPDWYVTAEHLAELLGAQARYDEAAAAYEKVVAKVPRPELYQALGDLLVFAAKPDAAKPWYAKAEALYTASISAGEDLFTHHAAGFYSDSSPDAAKALELATRDVSVRPSVNAWDSLAWAQYRAGQFKPALESIAKALATGIKDPHILYHASMIHMSAGDLKAGKDLLHQTVEVNPRYNTFHAHR